MMNDRLRALREAEFPVIHECAYLNHAGMAPLPRRSAQRMSALAELVSRTGDRRWLDRHAEVDRVRGLAARLLGAREPHEVAFVENTSTALSMIAGGLADLGFSVVSSRTPGETSGIVTATHPRLDPQELVKRLGERDVVVAARAGRFRVSPHFYNTEEEIDRCLGELAVRL